MAKGTIYLVWLVLGCEEIAKQWRILSLSVMQELIVNFMLTAFGNEPGSGRISVHTLLRVVLKAAVRGAETVDEPANKLSRVLDPPLCAFIYSSV